MIALDTNVLLRFLVQDDEDQGAIAARVIEDMLSSEEPGFVTIVAVLEMDWVLRTHYHYASSVVTDAIRDLMRSSKLVFEHRDAVESALAFEHGELADNVLHEVGKAKGCSKTVTFDRKFARLEGVELLA